MWSDIRWSDRPRTKSFGFFCPSRQMFLCSSRASNLQFSVGFNRTTYLCDKHLIST